MAVTSVNASEAYSGAPSISLAPLGSATGSSGGTSTTALTCTPCCAPPGYFLLPLFGPAGLCFGAVDNSVPVTLNATFNLTATSSYNLSDYCLPASATLSIASDNYTVNMATRFISWQSACSAISPPTTRLIPKESTAFYFWQPAGGQPYFYLQNNSIGFIDFCDCTSTGYNYLAKFGAMTLISYSCSPFSATFGTGSVYANSIVIGTWTVTLTL